MTQRELLDTLYDAYPALWDYYENLKAFDTLAAFRNDVRNNEEIGDLLVTFVVQELTEVTEGEHPHEAERAEEYMFRAADELAEIAAAFKKKRTQPATTD